MKKWDALDWAWFAMMTLSVSLLSLGLSLCHKGF